MYKFYFLPAALVGLLVGAVLPSVASTPVRDHFHYELIRVQRRFIAELDAAYGIKMLSFAQTTPALPFIKTALLACGNTALKRDMLVAARATEGQMQYAIHRFETAFCDPSC